MLWASYGEKACQSYEMYSWMNYSFSLKITCKSNKLIRFVKLKMVMIARVISWKRVEITEFKKKTPTLIHFQILKNEVRGKNYFNGK